MYVSDCREFTVRTIAAASLFALLYFIAEPSFAIVSCTNAYGGTYNSGSNYSVHGTCGSRSIVLDTALTTCTGTYSTSPMPSNNPAGYIGNCWGLTGSTEEGLAQHYVQVSACPTSLRFADGSCGNACTPEVATSGWAYTGVTGSQICIKGCAVKCASASCYASNLTASDPFTGGTWKQSGDVCSNGVAIPEAAGECTPESPTFTGQISKGFAADGTPILTNVCESTCPAGMKAGYVNGNAICISNIGDGAIDTNGDVISKINPDGTTKKQAGDMTNPKGDNDPDGDGIDSSRDKHPYVAGTMASDLMKGTDLDAYKGSFSIGIDCSHPPSCTGAPDVTTCSAMMQSFANHCSFSKDSGGSVWSMDEGCAVAFHCDAGAEQCAQLRNQRAMLCPAGSGDIATNFTGDEGTNYLDDHMAGAESEILSRARDGGVIPTVWDLFGDGSIADATTTTTTASSMFSSVLSYTMVARPDCPAQSASMTYGALNVPMTPICSLFDLTHWIVTAVFAFLALKFLIRSV